MRRDPIIPPEEEELRDRSRWLIILSRVVSGVLFLGGFVVSAAYFSGNELMLSILLMILPMAMIWYPREIDDLGKGGYGEGGASQIILAAFGWVCLFIYLAIIALRAEGYF